MCFDEVTCGTRDLLAQADSTIRYTINWAVQEEKVGLRRLLAGGLPETAAKVPKINNQNAEEQFAPANPRACTVEANVPGKPRPGEIAGGPSAPAEPEVLAVEAEVPAAALEPLVLAVEPRAPAWAQQIVRFLQTGELPDDPQEKITR